MFRINLIFNLDIVKNYFTRLCSISAEDQTVWVTGLQTWNTQGWGTSQSLSLANQTHSWPLIGQPAERWNLPPVISYNSPNQVLLTRCQTQTQHCHRGPHTGQSEARVWAVWPIRGSHNLRSEHRTEGEPSLDKNWPRSQHFTLFEQRGNITR